MPAAPALAPPTALAVTPAPTPPRELPSGTARTWRTVPIGALSAAGGAFEVDWARAHADAERVLAGIDFSRHDIVIWATGTNQHVVRAEFEDAVLGSQDAADTSLVKLEYKSSWHLRRSLPTGVATLKLVLEGIAQRLKGREGEHDVLLGGESQGAWVIGEALADPAFGGIVDRAILLGHPWLAQHQYIDGHDPRVRVINHSGDQIAMPVKGDPTIGLDAMIAVKTLQLSKLGTIVKGIGANPLHGWLVLKGMLSGLPVLDLVIRNAHDYSGDMSRAAEYLLAGTEPIAQGVHAAHTAPLVHVLGRMMGRPSGDEETVDERAARLQREAAIARSPRTGGRRLTSSPLDRDEQRSLPHAHDAPVAMDVVPDHGRVPVALRITCADRERTRGERFVRTEGGDQRPHRLLVDRPVDGALASHRNRQRGEVQAIDAIEQPLDPLALQRSGERAFRATEVPRRHCPHPAPGAASPDVVQRARGLRVRAVVRHLERLVGAEQLAGVVQLTPRAIRRIAREEDVRRTPGHLEDDGPVVDAAPGRPCVVGMDDAGERVASERDGIALAARVDPPDPRLLAEGLQGADRGLEPTEALLLLGVRHDVDLVGSGHVQRADEHDGGILGQQVRLDQFDVAERVVLVRMGQDDASHRPRTDPVIVEDLHHVDDVAFVAAVDDRPVPTRHVDHERLTESRAHHVQPDRVVEELGKHVLVPVAQVLGSHSASRR